MGIKIKIGNKIRQPAGFSAFVPEPFPPEGLKPVPHNILIKMSQADRLIGTLEGQCTDLPGFEVFTKLFVAQDATASSQIEGTRATLYDALHKEAQQKAAASTPVSKRLTDDVDDANDIILHWQALQHGIQRLATFPLSLRLICEVHKKLMQNGRSDQFSDPGNFRRSQNYIGGTRPDNARFVPPPVHEMKRALHDFEKFLHSASALPLVHAALAHAQFEAIHPFLDGNGRTGRILIALLLHQREILSQPVLFLSTYFKQHQNEYYVRINAYCEGDVWGWVHFFLDAAIDVAQQSTHKAKKIKKLKDDDMLKVQTLSKRESASSAKVLQYLFEQPYVMTTHIMQCTGFTRGGAQKLIDRLVGLDILHLNNDNKNYGRVYAYKAYLDIFGNEAPTTTLK